MIVRHSSRWLRLIDQASGVWLAFVGLSLTVIFAMAYWILTKNLPDHGIRGPDSETEFDIFAALYFSVVTETTLGYGDFRPVGISRLLVACHVLLGLAFAGIVVAKITSIPGRSLRLLSYSAGGDWVEVCVIPGSMAVILTHATIYYDGETVRYDGENFDIAGEPKGFFQSRLSESDDQLCRFRYSNMESTGDYFTNGVADLLFRGADKDGRWHRYHATAHDFGTKQAIVYEGSRLRDEEVSILRGTDFAARAGFIKEYITSHTNRVVLTSKLDQDA